MKKEINNTKKKAQKQSHRYMEIQYITLVTSEMNEPRTDYSVTDIRTFGSPYGKKIKLGPM